MKKFLILLIPFLITGCTMNYELEIKEDLSVEENATILNVETYYDIIGDIDFSYKHTVDMGMKSSGYTDYQYLKKDNLYGTTVTRKYNSLDSFKNIATSYKELYDDIDILKDGNLVVINSVGDLKIEKLVGISDNEAIEKIIPQSIYFSIKLPFKVVDSNADRIDYDHNIYYWDITTSTNKDKNLYISFDINKKHMSVKKTIENFDYTILIFAVIIIVGIIVMNNIINKNKKNNEL